MYGPLTRRGQILRDAFEAANIDFREIERASRKRTELTPRAQILRDAFEAANVDPERMRRGLAAMGR